LLNTSVQSHNSNALLRKGDAVDQIIETHESPDGLFRLLVTRGEIGNLTIGFEDFQWHTHGSFQADIYGVSEEEAVQSFIADLVSGKYVIAVYRRDNAIWQLQIDDCPDIQVPCEPGETLELRYWDGLPYRSGSIRT